MWAIIYLLMSLYRQYYIKYCHYIGNTISNNDIIDSYQVLFIFDMNSSLRFLYLLNSDLSLHFTVYSVQCKMHSVQCTWSSIRYTSYNNCTLYNDCTVYIVNITRTSNEIYTVSISNGNLLWHYCTVYDVQCTMYSV